MGLLQSLRGIIANHCLYVSWIVSLIVSLSSIVISLTNVMCFSLTLNANLTLNIARCGIVIVLNWDTRQLVKHLECSLILDSQLSNYLYFLSYVRRTRGNPTCGVDWLGARGTPFWTCHLFLETVGCGTHSCHDSGMSKGEFKLQIKMEI